MSSIFDSVFHAMLSAKIKTTPMRRTYLHSAALLLAACFAIGCGSEPEASVFPACDGPFDVPSWWKSFPSADIEGLALDPQGAILVAHRAGYGPDPFHQELVKLNANGELVWTLSLATSDINWLTTNDEGDIFLGGIADFGASSPFGGDPVASGPFMARLRADGTLVWLHSDKQLPDFGWLVPGLPVILSHDRQLLAFGGNAVTSLDPDSGDLLWRTQINYEQGVWYPSFKSATVDSNGDIWAVGSFEGTIELGGFSATSATEFPNGLDGFLARFSTTGTVLGLESFGESVYYGFNSIVAYPSGGVLIGKSFLEKTSYERRNSDVTVAQKWERPNQLYYLEQGTEDATYASGFKPHDDGIAMFLEEQDGQGALKWQRTIPIADPIGIGFGELRTLPACRVSALLAASYVSEGTDFGLGKIHCPEGRDDCVVVAISRP